MENIDLKAALESGIVTFKFKKANGEIRSASGTRRLTPAIALGITEEDMPKGVRKEVEGVISFWDIDKGAWRSCREDSLISIDKVSTEDELLGGDLFDKED